MADQVGAYHSFCSMKRLGVFLLPLDGMLDHRSRLKIRSRKFQGGESKVFCPRTQLSGPARARTHTKKNIHYNNRYLFWKLSFSNDIKIGTRENERIISYYSSLTKLCIPSFAAATLSEMVTMTTGKPAIKQQQ